MADYFDDLETRDPGERERALFDRLPGHLEDAVAHAPGLAAHLSGRDLSAVTSRDALAELPVLRKADLMDAQEKNPHSAASPMRRRLRETGCSCRRVRFGSRRD